jgi:NAD(P)-dependent dehydrogenase (short-subunit alcohol dehydrogenase family)
MTDLAGKTVLVTGGSRGIGRGMAEALAEAGARLIVTARTQADAETAAAQIGGGTVGLAFEAGGGADAIEAFADQAWTATRGIDAVFNNAGSVVMQPALETGEADWGALIDANLSSVFWSCQAFGRRMLERGRGKIVNVASDMGIRGEAGWSAYSASKGGVVALSKSLAWEWAPAVTVNIIAPGPFDTPSNAPAFSIPEVMEQVNARVPLGRVGRPREDLGPLAVLLAGSGSDFMTGAIFRVDGGICRS